MATLESLANRVRFELGDIGKEFVTPFIADGTTNRFKLHYAPLDYTEVHVFKNGTEIQTFSVEESTGVLVTDTVPAEGDEFLVSGKYYRYFTSQEVQQLVNDAFAQHSANHTDSLGRKLTISNLPLVEEYPLVIYAVTLALYTLATDSAFDIDIQAPDGVSIPRAERYRQLMEMVQTRENQYRELCALLGLGLYKIDVFTLRRISKATNRYVPVYLPQEVDDRSYPDRIDDVAPNYGDKPTEWPTNAGELTAYQGRSFATSVDFTGEYWGKSFVANLLNQRGSVLIVQAFNLSVTDNDSRTITAVSRTSGQTTVTITAANHGLTAGKAIAIAGINTELNTTWTVATIVNSNSFTITTTATTALALTNQTGSVAPVGTKSYTAYLSLTADQTLRLAERTYWSLSTVDSGNVYTEIQGGNFFTARSSTVVL
jgi:hypothetical protein